MNDNRAIEIIDKGLTIDKCSMLISLTVKEAEECAEVLGIDNADDFMRIFYPMLSIKRAAKGA